MTGREWDPSLPGRRSFCRVDDEVILNFRQLPAGNREAPGGSTSERSEDSFETFTVLSRIARQREHVRGLLRALRSEKPQVSRCIAALEERMQLLETWALLAQLGTCSAQRHTVRLSAGGMSFRTGSRFSTDAVLLLEIILLPSLTGVVSRGRVVRSIRQIGRDGDPPYLTAVEFIDMKEGTRDLITRHVLARQGRRRRCNQAEQRPGSA